MDKDSKIAILCSLIIKWGLYLFVFLTPLFFLPFNASVVELNKQLLLIAFSLIFLIAWLGKMIAQGKVEIRKSLLNIGIILFLVFCLVSVLLSKNLYQGLVGFGGTVSESFFALLGFAIIFFVVVNNFKKVEEISGLVFSLTLSGILAGIFGLMQLAGKFIFSWDFTEVFSFNTIGSANSLEIFLAALLVLSAVLFAETNLARWRQFFHGAAAIFFLFAILAINFPNVWWALAIAAIIIIALGIINREQMSQYRLILPMVVLAFAVLMLLTRLTVFSTWLNVPTEVSPSLSASIDINKQVIKNNLFFGTGPGSYSYDYGLYRSPVLNQTDFWNVRFNQGFSKMLSQPATLGLFGFATWILILAGFAVYGFVILIRRRGKNWALALGLFSAWFLLAFLQFLYAGNFTLEFVFWLTMALALLTLKTLVPVGKTEEDFKEEVISVGFDRNSPMASILSFSFVIVLVVSISAFYLGGTYYYADVLYQRGSLLVSQKNDLENGSAAVSKAVLLNPYNDLYLRTFSQIALLRVNEEFSKPQSVGRDSLIQNYSAVAINIAKRTTDLASLNVDNWVQRAAIYRAVMPYTNGADQWAFDSYEGAIKLEPNNPFYYLELGRAYVLAADLLSYTAGQDQEKQAKMNEYLKKGEEALSKSVELKPDYAPAIFQLSLVYDREGMLDEAIAKMKETRDIYPQDIGVAFQLGLLYYKQPSLDLARTEFERAVMLDTNYSNARYFLGLIYDKQGDKAKAIEQFEKIAELNPDNQDVKTILDNLRAGKPAIAQQPSQLPIPEQEPQEESRR
ncbi:tetratricopeptide repeat protein [Patescibacteria group bacterium]|nr:tetratricopeptide repeat protein [Patescibacteria group bacterium]